jgi:hypothetical protein
VICTLRSGTRAWRHPKVPVGWNLPGQAWRIRLVRSLGVWLAQLETTVLSWHAELWLAMHLVYWSLAAFAADGGCVRRRLPAENPDQPAHRGRPAFRTGTGSRGVTRKWWPSVVASTS